MDESTLVEGCRAHDREVQRELYERHADRVYRVALRLTRNPQDAFDLTQETFVRALENIDSFDGRASISSWLYRIVTNEGLQLLRRRQNEQKHLVAAAATRTAWRADGPDEAKIEQTLARLSDEHRAILLLKYRENMSYGEIAEVLDIQSGTVGSRLSRARAELRRLLKKSESLMEETRGLPHPTNVPDVDKRSADDV